jgi:hypothetical protein
MEKITLERKFHFIDCFREWDHTLFYLQNLLFKQKLADAYNNVYFIVWDYVI